MFHVYFLKNLANHDLYIGSCENLQKRLDRHNRGLVKSTKAYRPWTIIGHEAYETRREAVQKERFYKTGQQRELLKLRFKDL